jgi:hypothetical protein
LLLKLQCPWLMTCATGTAAVSNRQRQRRRDTSDTQRGGHSTAEKHVEPDKVSGTGEPGATGRACQIISSCCICHAQPDTLAPALAGLQSIPLQSRKGLAQLMRHAKRGQQCASQHFCASRRSFVSAFTVQFPPQVHG